MHADRVRICIVTPIGLTAFLSRIPATFRAFSACRRWERVTGLDDSRNERRQIIFLLLLLNEREGGTEPLSKRSLDLSYFLSYVYRAVRGMSISTLFSKLGPLSRRNTFRDIICHFVRHSGRTLSKAGNSTSRTLSLHNRERSLRL